MIILAQQNGAGPIVTLWMGPGSAQASLPDAPVAETPLATDFVLILRSGRLQLVPMPEIVSSTELSTMVEGVTGAQTNAFLSALASTLPTSPEGLALGQWWSDGGILTQVTAL